MAETKFTQLPVAVYLDGTEQVPMAKSDGMGGYFDVRASSAQLVSTTTVAPAPTGGDDGPMLTSVLTQIAAGGQSAVSLNWRTYTCLTPIVAPDGIVVCNGTLDYSNVAAADNRYYAIGVKGTMGAKVLLTADATPNVAEVFVADASSFVVGAPVLLAQDTSIYALAAPLAATDTTVTLNSVSGLPASGEILNASTGERISYSSIAGNVLTVRTLGGVLGRGYGNTVARAGVVGNTVTEWHTGKWHHARNQSLQRGEIKTIGAIRPFGSGYKLAFNDPVWEEAGYAVSLGAFVAPLTMPSRLGLRNVTLLGSAGIRGTSPREVGVYYKFCNDIDITDCTFLFGAHSAGEIDSCSNGRAVRNRIQSKVVSDPTMRIDFYGLSLVNACIGWEVGPTHCRDAFKDVTLYSGGASASSPTYGIPRLVHITPGYFTNGGNLYYDRHAAHEIHNAGDLITFSSGPGYDASSLISLQGSSRVLINGAQGAGMWRAGITHNSSNFLRGLVARNMKFDSRSRGAGATHLTTAMDAGAQVIGFTQATQAVVTVVSVPVWLFNDVEIAFASLGGFSGISGVFYTVSDLSGSTFKLKDSTGNYLNTSSQPAYTGGGYAFFTTLYVEDASLLVDDNSPGIFVNTLVKVGQEIIRVNRTNTDYTQLVEVLRGFNYSSISAHSIGDLVEPYGSADYCAVDLDFSQHRLFRLHSDSPRSTLTGALTSSATTISVADITSWPVPSGPALLAEIEGEDPTRIWESEIVSYTGITGGAGVSGTLIGVVRGLKGPRAVAHSSGAFVQPFSPAVVGVDIEGTMSTDMDHYAATTRGYAVTERSRMDLRIGYTGSVRPQSSALYIYSHGMTLTGEVTGFPYGISVYGSENNLDYKCILPTMDTSGGYAYNLVGDRNTAKGYWSNFYTAMYIYAGADGNIVDGSSVATGLAGATRLVADNGTNTIVRPFTAPNVALTASVPAGGTLSLPAPGDWTWSLTSTNTLNVIPAQRVGTKITLIFQAATIVNDATTSAGNIKPQGRVNRSMAVGSVMILVCDGTYWVEP